MYEVELKFPMPDPAAVLTALGELGADRHEPVEQRDLYLAHPVRDFASTDEAFRIRTTGDENVVTYKGPLVDKTTKTRREIEIPFEAGRANDLEAMFAALGFSPVRAVEKTRTPFDLDWEGIAVEATLDEVRGLGTWLELEATADDDSLPAVRESILRLAEHLGLGVSERRSYLALLLARHP